MLALLIGLVFVVCGLWGLFVWWCDFVAVARGLFPILFAVGGLIAVIAGATSMSEQGPTPEEKEAGQKK